MRFSALALIWEALNALGHRVVPAVTLATHALQETVGLADLDGCLAAGDFEAARGAGVRLGGDEKLGPVRDARGARHRTVQAG